MKNKLFVASATWAGIGLASGVFYREFTKLSDFTGVTQLSVVHTHALMLGAFFFLIALALEKLFHLSEHAGRPGLYFWAWNIGLTMLVGMLTFKGILQVRGVEWADHPAIAGIHGLGHIILAFAFVMFFLNLKAAINADED